MTTPEAIDIEDSFPVGSYVENTATTGIHRGKVGVVQGYTRTKKSVCVLLGGETHARNFLPQNLCATGRRPESIATPVVSSNARDEASPHQSSPSPIRPLSRNVERVDELINNMEFPGLLKVYRLLGKALARAWSAHSSPN